MTLFCIFFTKQFNLGGHAGARQEHFGCALVLWVLKCLWWEKGGPFSWQSWLVLLVPVIAMPGPWGWGVLPNILRHSCLWPCYFKLHASWKGLALLQCTIRISTQKFEYMDTESQIRSNKSPFNQSKSKNQAGGLRGQKQNSNQTLTGKHWNTHI